MFQVFFKVKCHIYLSLKKKIFPVGEINLLTTVGIQKAEKNHLGKQAVLNCKYKAH